MSHYIPKECLVEGYSNVRVLSLIFEYGIYSSK
jgi:hypothetical protein